MPTVSIIIPLYNQSQVVGEAIESALDQTFKDFEVIVVDDGSTDTNQEVVARFGNQVRYLRQDNQGLAGARNTGIRAANGEFIGLLDADDQWQPDYLGTMISLSTRHPEAAVYYCQARCMDADGLDLNQILGGPVRPPNMIYQTLLRANFLIPSTILMRRSILIEAGLFDQSLRSCEDWDLWLRLLPEHKFIGSDNCLVRYRLHGKSLSANLDGMHRAARSVIEKNFGPEDKNWEEWPKIKQLAYGGFYRYHALTSVMRDNDWSSCKASLHQALQVDPSLSTDIGLYYDLAMGSQPLGYRGTPYRLDLKFNATRITQMLSEIFKDPAFVNRRNLQKQTYGTAYFALGLIAYNTGQTFLCRKFLLKAIINRPELCHNSLVVGDLIKSYFSRSMIRKIREFHPKKIHK